MEKWKSARQLAVCTQKIVVTNALKSKYISSLTESQRSPT